MSDSKNDITNISKICKALCDENRLAIIKLLQTSEHCACHISDKLGIAQSKLSYHMKILCESGIVESWYVGKWTHYRISSVGCDNALSIFKEIITADGSSPAECDCAG